MEERVEGRPGHRTLVGEPLTAGDWADIWQFYRYVWGPFVERIVLRARQRAAEEVDRDGVD